MPISSISGLAGTVGGMQDPSGLAAFADHLERAQQAKRQDAIQQLDLLFKLTTESEGRFVPEEGVVEKLMKQAGMPKAMLSGGQAPGPWKAVGAPGAPGGPGGPAGPPSPQDTVFQRPADTRGGGGMGGFEAIADVARRKGDVAEAQRQSQIMQAKMDQHDLTLQQTLIDPKATPEQKAQAQTGRLLLNKITMQQFLDSNAIGLMTLDEKTQIGEIAKSKLLEKKTEAEYEQMAQDLAPKILANYDGDFDKALRAARLNVRGQQLPKDLQPPMTAQNLAMEFQVWNALKDSGLPRVIQQQMILEKTLDPGKVWQKYGWNEELVTQFKNAKSLEERRVGATEVEAEAVRKRTEIAAQAEERESFAATAKAVHELLTGMGSDPELKALNARLEAARRLELINKKLDPTMKETLEADVARALGLQKKDARNFVDWWAGRQYEPTLPVPTDLLKDQKPPGAAAGPSTSRQQLWGLVTNPFDPINKALASIPGAADKLFGALDKALDESSGGTTTPTPAEIIQKAGPEVDSIIGKAPDLMNRLADWIDKIQGVPPLAPKSK